MPPIRREKRSSESNSAANSDGLKYFQILEGYVYLQITDIAKNRDNLLNSTVLSWLFPKNVSGAKIPHSSIIAFGHKYEYSTSGVTKHAYSNEDLVDANDNIIQFIEFRDSMARIS